MISDLPLLYRTHYELSELMQIPSQWNKLIFVTRNPKELLFRSFFLTSPSTPTPDLQFIQSFLDTYLKAFEVYNSWSTENRTLVLYEDFIEHGDDILCNLLKFMGEPAIYLSDFMEHKEYYTNQILQSYQSLQEHNKGGSSSIGGSKAIYYTKNIPCEVLKEIDQYIQEKAPFVWEQYIKRFETP